MNPLILEKRKEGMHKHAQVIYFVIYMQIRQCAICANKTVMLMKQRI